MKKHTLSAVKRTLVGRKVKQLRKQGLLPITVYGKNVKSTSATVATEDFAKIHKVAGGSGLIDLTFGDAVQPVLIHHIQVDPVTSKPLHVEFHQVDLKEKVTANVPLVITGESPVVREKLGVILSILDEIEVEALPTQLPENILVDVSSLIHVNAEVKVSDLAIPMGVEVKTDPDLTVVKIGPLITKEAEAQAAAEEAAQAAAKIAEAPEVPEGTEVAPTPTEPTAPVEKE